MLRLFWKNIDEIEVEIRDMKWFCDQDIHDINFMWHGNHINLGLLIKDDDKVIFTREVAREPRGYFDPEGAYMEKLEAQKTDEQMFFESIQNELKYRKASTIKRVVLNIKYFPEYFKTCRELVESGKLEFQDYPVVLNRGNLLENHEVYKIEMEEGWYLQMGQKKVTGKRNALWSFHTPKQDEPHSLSTGRHRNRPLQMSS